MEKLWNFIFKIEWPPCIEVVSYDIVQPNCIGGIVIFINVFSIDINQTSSVGGHLFVGP